MTYSASINHYHLEKGPSLSAMGLICWWDFRGDHPLTSKGPQNYTFKEGNGPLEIQAEKDISGVAIELREGQYLYIPRKECPALNIHGKGAQVTVMAWVKRSRKSYIQCEAIAGMWNETLAMRQYCLFLNLRLFDSADQVCGHISGVGGPTSGEKWCIDASIGQTPVTYEAWTFVAFTYNGAAIESYFNGERDPATGRNPYSYEQGIFDSGENGSDFTVGAVHRMGEMGNNFAGKISGLAVFNRALSPEEIKNIYDHFPVTYIAQS